MLRTLLSEQPNHCEPAGRSADGSADHFNKAVRRRARARAAYLHERESSCEVPLTPATGQRLPVAVKCGGARAEATMRLVCARAADLARRESLRRSEEVVIAERESSSLGAWRIAGADARSESAGGAVLLALRCCATLWCNAAERPCRDLGASCGRTFAGRLDGPG